jgi:hypothetical protein
MKHWTVTGISLAALVLMVAATLCAKDPAAPVLPSVRSSVEANRRQLWRSSIQTPRGNGDSSGLQEAIDRLQKSMHVRKPPPPVKRRVVTTRPATTQPANPTTMPATGATTRPSVMTSEIKERIRKLNSIADPAALADALFQAKHPDLAALFYDRALKGKTTPKVKAWVLFQAGNCRRKTNPKVALKAYETLVAAHPDSLWSSIALVQKGIVEWQNTNKLAALLKDIEKQGQQSSSSPDRK